MASYMVVEGKACECSGFRHVSTGAASCWRAAREKVIGWYHTGPRIREADLDISALMGSYCNNPLLVICEVEVGLRLSPCAGHCPNGWAHAVSSCGRMT